MRISFEDKTNGNKAYSEITNLPGCSQVAVSHDLFVVGQGQGTGTRAHQDRLNKLVELGYDAVICTVASGNIAQEKILKKFQWIKLTSFISSKTGHTVEFYYKNLQKG